MKKYFYTLSIFILLIGCSSEDDSSTEPTAQPFELDSITAIEENTGKSNLSSMKNGNLSLTINGTNISSSEILDETFESITFGYSNAEIESLSSGRISISFTFDSEGTPISGRISVQDDNGESDQTTFPASIVSFEVITFDELGPTGGIISIRGNSDDGDQIDISVLIDNS